MKLTQLLLIPLALLILSDCGNGDSKKNNSAMATVQPDSGWVNLLQDKDLPG